MLCEMVLLVYLIFNIVEMKEFFFYVGKILQEMFIFMINESAVYLLD